MVYRGCMELNALFFLLFSPSQGLSKKKNTLLSKKVSIIVYIHNSHIFFYITI